MAQNQWTAIRVSRDTRAKLAAIRERLISQGGRDGIRLGDAQLRSGEASKRDEIGFDQVVRRLIEHFENHRRRRARSALERRKASGQGELPDVLAGDVEPRV